MSILPLLKQAEEIRSEIRKEFQTLSLEEKLKLALITKNAHILRETLLSSVFIPYGLSTEFLAKVIPYAERYEQFDLEKALAGEPLIDLHNNEKCWLYKSHKMVI